MTLLSTLPHLALLQWVWVTVNRMSWIPLNQRLEQLPLILAGPILRRVEPSTVTVWVTLRSPCTITLSVHTTQGDGTILQQVVLKGERSTVAIGNHLHIAAVTAQPVDDRTLVPKQIYAYDLQFEPRTQSSDSIAARLTLEQALNSGSTYSFISYFDHQKPTFSLPPEELNLLRIVHGSCRKPHGGDYDTLPILDEIIGHTARLPDQRPHQLFCTGDQIYGDDVANALLWALTDAGNTLLGWEEALPAVSINGGRYLSPQQLLPGQRSNVAEKVGGFTAGLHNQEERCKSHLFSFAEYCACYLFLWSPVLWHDVLPTARDVGVTSKSAKFWNKEARRLREFRHTLWKVRRSLANVPTYMIFDDHDISDDWYLNQAWCLRVLGKPLGRQTVRNGLLAYALFQGWGNTPEQFQPGQAGDRLLQAVEKWSASGGIDSTANQAIVRYLGLPEIDPTTDLPKMRLDESVLVLDRSPDALSWHFTVRGPRHEVVVLDTRTWRGYPAEDEPTAPAMLLSPTAFDRQIRAALTHTDHLNATAPTAIDATFVIAPTNLVSLQVIDQIQRWNLQQRQVFHNDVGDAWNLHTAAFAELLAALFERRDRVIVLTGDIHYSAAVRLNYWSPGFPDPKSNGGSKVGCQLAQLTCSAMKNSEFKTQLVHTKLKSLLPERSQEQIGWNHAAHPMKMPDAASKVPKNKAVAKPIPILQQHSEQDWAAAVRDRKFAPDWRYRIEWMPRQPAQAPVWGQTVSWLTLPSRRDANWLQPLQTGVKWLWCNRWLQEGREVVGRSNLGVVSLQWEPDCTVQQDVYWYAPWKARTIVMSRYLVPLLGRSEGARNEE